MSQLILSIDGAETTTEPVVIPPTVTASAKQVTWFVVWPPGVTAGKVVVEGAHDEDFEGLWHNFYTSDLANGAVADSCEIGTYPGYIRAVRARIETEVEGGDAPGVKVFFSLGGDV